MIAAERCTFPGVFLSVYELLIWRALARGPKSLQEICDAVHCQGKRDRREVRILVENLVDRDVLKSEGEIYWRA